MRPTEWVPVTDLASFRRSLRSWFRVHRRELPWRRTRDTYRIWVSEIMLQQTQVATVIEYYDRFLRRFPTLKALASADLADVLHAWQGMGYYRRAQSLHRAAQIVQHECNGKIPTDPQFLARLPGIGRYTANAIACFSSNRRLGVLETNTIRLWTRLCAAGGNPRSAPLHHELWQLACDALPQRNPADFNQALMDLGSTVCRPRDPDCAHCPVRSNCLAYLEGQPLAYPQLAPSKAPIDVDHVAVVLRAASSVLLAQRGTDGLWGHLWEFPRVERRPGENRSAAATRALRAVTNAHINVGAAWLTFTHHVLHYRVRLTCFEAVLPRRFRPRRTGHEHVDARWFALARLGDVPLSSPQRRIADSLRVARSVEG